MQDVRHEHLTYTRVGLQHGTINTTIDRHIGRAIESRLNGTLWPLRFAIEMATESITVGEEGSYG